MKNLFFTIKSNFLFFVLFLWIMVPYFAFNQFMRGLALMAIIIITIKYFKIGNRNILYLTLFFIVYTFVINIIASDGIYLLRHLQLYIFLFLAYISTIVLRFNPKKQQQLLTIILVLNIIALIGTYLGLLIDSHVARDLVRSDESTIKLTEGGIGGYGVVYMNVLMYPLLLYIIKKTKNKKTKYLAWINMVFIVLVILKAGYLIAILLSIFQLFYLLLYKRTVIIKVLFFLMLTLGSFSMYNNIDYIEKVTYPYVEGTSLSYKHQDIFDQLKGNDSEYGSVEGRIERYNRSINLFFTNPLIGVLSFNNIGKHSNILDIFGQFGFIFGLIFVFLLKQLPFEVKKKIPSQYKLYTQCFLGTIILLGLLNNYAMQHGIVFILLACIVSYNSDKLEVTL